jgi:2-dehydro-3-deoxygluconokinase
MDVVTFGETMVLFSSEHILPLEYVHQYNKQIGGAESNVAIGLIRQGHKAGWFSKLGEDAFGRFVQNSIRGEGVDTTRCLFTDVAPTGIFFKERKTEDQVNVYYYRNGSAASHLTPQDLDEEYISQAKILHISGITPALSETAYGAVMKAIEIAKRHDMKISFDPNIRMKLMEASKLREILLKITKEVDYILTGLDEGEFLTGGKIPETVTEILMRQGAGTVIVKLGKKGAYYQTKTDSGYVAGFPVEKVVDPIGAGDGFTSGFLSGILLNESIADSVRRGNAVGSRVIQVNGDIEGLPTRDEVNSIIQQSSTTLNDVNR